MNTKKKIFNSILSCILVLSCIFILNTVCSKIVKASNDELVSNINSVSDTNFICKNEEKEEEQKEEEKKEEIEKTVLYVPQVNTEAFDLISESDYIYSYQGRYENNEIYFFENISSSMFNVEINSSYDGQGQKIYSKIDDFDTLKIASDTNLGTNSKIYFFRISINDTESYEWGIETDDGYIYIKFTVSLDYVYQKNYLHLEDLFNVVDFNYNSSYTDYWYCSGTDWNAGKINFYATYNEDHASMQLFNKVIEKEYTDGTNSATVKFYINDVEKDIAEFPNRISEYNTTYTFEFTVTNEFEYVYYETGRCSIYAKTIKITFIIKPSTIDYYSIQLNNSDWEGTSGDYYVTFDGTNHSFLKKYGYPEIESCLYDITSGEPQLITNSNYVKNVGKYKFEVKLSDDTKYKWYSSYLSNYIRDEENNSYYINFEVKQRTIDKDDIKISYNDGKNTNRNINNFGSSEYPLTIDYSGNEFNFNLVSSFTTIDYKIYNVNDLENEATIKDVGTYKVVIAKEGDETSNYVVEAYDFYIAVNQLYISLEIDPITLEYGFALDELTAKINKKLSTLDVSDEVKNEILNHTIKVVNNSSDYENPYVYTDEELLALVPDVYYFTFVTEQNDGGEKTTVYSNEYYVGENYTVILDSYAGFTVTKRNVEIVWTENDFTYNQDNQFDKISAYYLDKDGKKVNLNVENTTSNEFKDANEYRFIASFDSDLNTEEFIQSDYYVLPIVSQKYYQIKKCSINWNNVSFNKFKIEYEKFIVNPDAESYIESIKVKGLDSTNDVNEDDITIVYDLSNVKAYNGKYVMTATISSDNYEIDEEHQVLTNYFIVGAKVQTIENKVEDEIAIIEAADEGDVLDPTLRLIVETIEDNKDSLQVEIKKTTDANWKDQVIGVYDVSLVDEDNVKVQPDGTLKISLQVPEEIANGEYEIYHRHVDENGNVTITKLDITRGENGYATFITTELSEFIFVYKYKSLIWLMIIVSILILAAFALVLYQVYSYLVKSHKMNKLSFKKKTMMLSVAPVFYMPGHVDTVLTLAIVLAGIVVLNLALYFVFKALLTEKAEKIEVKVLEEKTKEIIEEKKVENKEPKKEVEVKPVIEEAEPLTLSESMAMLDSIKSNASITKKTIADYLLENHKDDAVVNNRENYTKASKGNKQGLPLADTHYVKLSPKNVCFTYVYENNDGNVLILLKTSEEHIELLKQKHKNIASSRFPKVVDGLKWYSLPIDNSYGFNQVVEMLEESMKINGNANYSPVVSGKIKPIKPQKKEEWATKVLEQFDKTNDEITEDENGIPVVAVFFKNPYNKLYYFKYEDIDYKKGDILDYSRVKGDHRKVVVAIPKIKMAENKLKLPLMSLKDNQEA